VFKQIVDVLVFVQPFRISQNKGDKAKNIICTN